MNRVTTCLFSLLIAIAIGACSRPGDYLYYVADRPVAKTYDSEHPIKELQGHSEADILWVIDNSGSMSNWQSAVAINTASFMSGFVKKATLDWKMGLISTDTADQPYVGFTAATLLDTTTADPAVTFQNAVGRLGTKGSGTEKAFEPLQQALTNYPSFPRPRAVLVFIIVTDAPEQSSMPPQDFIDFVHKVKGDLKQVVTYGIFGPQDWGCPQTDDYWEYKGSRYESLVNATNGKVYKLCDPNFAQNLVNLGQDIGQRISQPRLPLEDRPLESSLHVYYKDRELPGGPQSEGGFWFYDYEGNAIVFYNLDFAPGDTEQVRVVYQQDDGRPVN